MGNDSGFPITPMTRDHGDHAIFLQPAACISQPQTPPGY
jgi:hypothetical protein